jgi:hypothetical protein
MNFLEQNSEIKRLFLAVKKFFIFFIYIKTLKIF